MKIIILGPAHPYRGGIAALNDRLARQLQNEGHQVTLYNFKLQYPGFLFPGKSQLTDDPAPAGLSILRRVNSVNPFNWLKVGREVRKLCPDLLIVRFWIPLMGPSLGTICRLARKNRHTKVICIADNMIPHEKRPGDYLLTKYFTGGVDGFIGMSKEVYDDVAKFVKNPRRRYTPHPIYDHYGENVGREEAIRLLGLDAEKKYLLFFGFIREYKGLDLLLQAMARPELSDRNLQLIVAGEFYSDPKPYLEFIQKHDLEDRVHFFTEYIPNTEVNRFFCAADMIVQPYKSATQSGVTQVGYHFDKPMLVTNVGGLGEIIDHGQSGYVVEPDPDFIAKAIADFYANNRQADFIRATIALKEKYSWSKMTSVITELYEELP